MYTPSIPIGEEKLVLVRLFNVFNSFVAHGDISYSKNSNASNVSFKMLAPNGDTFGVYEVSKLDKSKGDDIILFYGDDEFFYEIDMSVVNEMRDGSYEAFIVEKGKVFSEFMEFLYDYYPDWVLEQVS